jgi:hypothetical protein
MQPRHVAASLTLDVARLAIIPKNLGAGLFTTNSPPGSKRWVFRFAHEPLNQDPPLTTCKDVVESIWPSGAIPGREDAVGAEE